MTDVRAVAAWVAEPPVPPRGLDAEAWQEALAADLVDALLALTGVEVAIAADPARRSLAERVRWPGTGLVQAAGVAELFRAGPERGWSELAVVAADAPDLPVMLLGKVFGGLQDRPVAVLPAAGGGFVVVAARLPAPEWLLGRLGSAGLDHGTLQDLRTAAGLPRQVAAAPGWHRLRTPADVQSLDDGLEGWDATRALLEGRPL
jgi:hypothetical protein